VPAGVAVDEAREDRAEDGLQRHEASADDADVEFDGGPCCGADVVPGYVLGFRDFIDGVKA
jgi:hypothetical protein